MTEHLCDTDVWLALALSGHVQHEATRDWLDGVEEAQSIWFCRATQQSLLRLLTNAAVLAPYGVPPRTNAEAWAIYDAFVADERVAFQEREPDGLEVHWRAYAERSIASPRLWMDAYLAAFARAAGLQLVTTDSGFRQFEGVDVLLLRGGHSP